MRLIEYVAENLKNNEPGRLRAFMKDFETLLETYDVKLVDKFGFIIDGRWIEIVKPEQERG